jgi:hypothetical protein
MQMCITELKRSIRAEFLIVFMLFVDMGSLFLLLCCRPERATRVPAIKVVGTLRVPQQADGTGTVPATY